MRTGDGEERKPDTVSLKEGDLHQGYCKRRVDEKVKPETQCTQVGTSHPGGSGPPLTTSPLFPMHRPSRPESKDQQ